MSTPTPPRVLVVTDDPETGGIVREVLAGRGYDTQCLSNAQVTPARLAAARPDLVVLDMFTPLLHEWPLLDNLLRIAHPPPLVALTGRCLSPDALAAVTFHGRGHLQKPFAPDALLRLCERMVSPPPPPPAGVDGERRAQDRYRFAGDATLLTDKGRPAVVLQMLDTSPSGAKIEIGGLLPRHLVAGATLRMILSVPPRFQPKPVEARVEWREGDVMGIRFTSGG